MTAIKTHLKSAQKSREMAAFLAARFVTRLDLRDEQLPSFIDYCFEVSCPFGHSFSNLPSLLSM